MQEKLKEIICCNQAVMIMRNAEHPETRAKGIGIWCDKCGLRAFHENEKTCISMIESEIKEKQESLNSQGELDLSREKDQRPPQQQKKKESKKVNKQAQQSTALAIIPKNAGELETYFHKQETHLIEITSPVIGDKSAMLRLINNNMRYVQNLKGDAWKKIWSTEEGQESIIFETEEAMMLGAEMGKMGDLVPFGAVCQFIPSVEAYEFALTNGKNAPFTWIKIENKFYGDEIKCGRKDGDFFIDFELFGDRLKVEKVFVYGLENKSNTIIGELYAAERLLEKAAEHSLPYKNYLKIMKAFEYAKTEGRTSTDPNGREFFSYYTINDVSTDKYFQKSVDNFYAMESAGKLRKDSKGEYAVETIPKGPKGPWEKKTYRHELEGGMEERIIFIDELTNPYAGPDQPEMLRKAAGKSFLRKYSKVRNSEAAMEEVRSHKKTVDGAFDLAEEIID